MMDDFRGLSPKLRERANAKMEAIQGQIVALQRQLVDLREPWSNLKAELMARKKALTEATSVLGNGAAGRQKTEALNGVINRIVCRFSHTSTKTGKKRGKSILEHVEIEPISGAAVCFNVGSKPAPN